MEKCRNDQIQNFKIFQMAFFDDLKEDIDSAEENIRKNLQNFEKLPADKRNQRIQVIEKAIQTMELYLNDASKSTYNDVNQKNVQSYLKEKQNSLNALKNQYRNCLQRSDLMEGVHTNIHEGGNKIIADQKVRVNDLQNQNNQIFSGMRDIIDIGSDIVDEMGRQKEVGDSMMSHLDNGSQILDVSGQTLKKIRNKGIKRVILTWVAVILALAFIIVFFYFVFRSIE